MSALESRVHELNQHVDRPLEMAEETVVEVLRSRLRAQFAPLRHDPPVCFLDNAAGSLVPDRVVDAVAGVLSSRGVCNQMASYSLGREQISLVKAAHEASALFVNAPGGADEIALGPSSTAMAFRLSSAFARVFGEGDVVVVSGLEHECNASPWRELSKVGVQLRVWEPRWPAGSLHVDDLAPLLADGRVRLVALTGASNAFGLLTPIAAAARAAHAAGAWIIVDAVHLSPHIIPDVARDDLDFLLFSPYKVCVRYLCWDW
jgi:selenocysteine lyase/cysteine desulfurase